MGLRSVERRLEQLVEGTFGRVFRSSLRPVELGRRLVRVMDDGRTVGVGGQVVAPNHFLIKVAAEDQAQLEEAAESLRRELADAARVHAREEGYAFIGPVTTELVVDGRLRTGSYRIEARVRENPGGRGPGSIVTAAGERVVLAEAIATIGRLSECTIALHDPNVSRVHAEIRPAGTGFLLVDAGSTNGTRVNGDRISQRQLRDGDEITIGTSRLRFEAS